MRDRLFSLVRASTLALLPLLVFGASPAGAQCPGVNCTASNVVNMPIDGPKATYSSGSSNVAFAASPTDIVQICGSSTKTIRVTAAWLSGFATAVTTTPAALNFYTTAAAGGTTTAESIVPYDSTQAAATAVVNAFTTGPSPGTLTGVVWGGFVTLGNKTTGLGTGSLNLNFGQRPAHAIVLRGASQCLSWTMLATSLSGNAISAGFEWTEE